MKMLRELLESTGKQQFNKNRKNVHEQNEKFHQKKTWKRPEQTRVDERIQQSFQQQTWQDKDSADRSIVQSEKKTERLWDLTGQHQENSRAPEGKEQRDRNLLI